MNQQIKKYLYDYLLDVKNNKLSDNLNKSKHLYKTVTKFVDKYTKKNPHIIGVLFGGNSSADLMDKDFLDKMSRISTIFSTFQNLNFDEINKKAKQIDNDLDTLIAEIKLLDPSVAKNMSIIKMPDEIINNLEDTRINAINFSKGMKINTDKLKISVPVDKLSLPNLDKLNYFTQTIQALVTRINEISKKISDGNQLTDNQLVQLENDITTNEQNIIEIKKVLSSALIELLKNNDKITKEYEYNFNKSEIAFVQPISELIKKIEGVAKSNSDPFIIAINAKATDFKNNNIKEKDFVREYNDKSSMVSNKDLLKYELPSSYFSGKYTKRIENNFLMNDADMSAKFKVLESIFEKNDDIKYLSKNPNLNTFKGMYSPDFAKFKEPVQTTTPISGTNIIGTPLYGGNINGLSDKVAKLSNEVLSYSEDLNKYKQQVKIYNKLQLQLFTHTMFLTLIVTNQLFAESYVVYEYINRGTITFYDRIVKNILKKIDEHISSDEILYFKKYHMITLMKLSSFLDGVSQNVDAKNVIDIKNCKGETANRFLLLNYFKLILESYREQYQNAITIYARINDIKQVINVSDIATFKQSKMFISDFERQHYKNQKDPKFKSNNPNIKLDKDTIDNGLMYIRASTCDTLDDMLTSHNTSKYPNLDWVTSYKFTEVFDSVQFPMNSDISKYMTLDTQLSKGKGVAIMTYGYSGTGKTFTLFGSYKDGKEGILQSTLDNINKLDGVKFRLFELYGYGLTYPHYWTNDITGAPRINDISHEIYKYDIIVKPSQLTYDKVTRIDAKDIASYINDHTGKHDTYTTISGASVSEIFRNFEDFMNQIELQRKGLNKDGGQMMGSTKEQNNEIKRKRTIRDTPNNIVSSRSVLVYDFILQIDNKDVPFLIIDLPGREEIIQTYIDPFFSNKHIIDILKQSSLGADSAKFDGNIAFIKMLLATMSLNPVATPIFTLEMVGGNMTNIIFNFINNHNDRSSIFNAELESNFEFSEQLIYDKHHTMTSQKVINIHERYIFNDAGDAIIGVKDGVNKRGFKLLDEIVNRMGTSLHTFFRIENNKLVFDTTKHVGFGYSKTVDYQYLAMIGIHIMNRLIILNRFDIIYELYIEIIDKLLNKYLLEGVEHILDADIPKMFKNLKDTNFKGEIIELVNDKNKTKDKLKEVIQYDYHLTPFEGIYINENIAGLIKYLAETMITDTNDKIEFLRKLKTEMSQPEGLNFQYQQKMARIWLMSYNEIKATNPIAELINFYGLDKSDNPITLTTTHDNDIDFDIQNIETAYKLVSASYRSNGIFNFDKPLITDILNPYIKEINDYKVFYLFGNYDDAKNGSLRNVKCSHQYSLLENTKDFIETIVKN